MYVCVLGSSVIQYWEHLDYHFCQTSPNVTGPLSDIVFALILAIEVLYGKTPLCVKVVSFLSISPLLCTRQLRAVFLPQCPIICVGA